MKKKNYRTRKKLSRYIAASYRDEQKFMKQWRERAKKHELVFKL